MDLPDAPRLGRGYLRTVPLAAAILLSLSGCNDTVDNETEKRNQDLASELGAELEASGDYTRLSSVYVDDASTRRQLGIEIFCTVCDPKATAESTMEMAWQSRITPLASITVSVSNTKTGPREHLVADVDDDEQALTRKYGERPVANAPEE